MGFQTVKLDEIQSNPFRNEESYQYDQAKIDALKESISDTSFWENLLARKTKDGAVQLAYGHHRLQALKQLVADGLEDYVEIKINVRPETQLTNERMLKIFAQENKDDWGENPSNLCMTVLQLQAHLEGLLSASKNKEEFFKKIGDAGSLKMDARSFTRAKNSGVGASLIASFLGDTWSRQTINDALQVIEKDKATFELAQKLPSVTLANRFQKLVTKGEKKEEGEKIVEMFDEATQRKVQDKIMKNDLTRAEVESAIKLRDKDPDKDPVKAINAVVEQKKEAIKAAKESAEQEKPTPKEPVEKVLGHVQRLLEATRKERVNLTKKNINSITKAIGLVIDVLENPPEEPESEDKE